MKYLRYLAMLSLLMLPLAYSHAEVRVGIGFGPTYVAGSPVCAYGYYGYYPYACAPYGYYGPSYFVNGVFIGAGPWYHGWARPYYGRRFYDRDDYYGPRWHDRDDYRRGYHGRGYERHEFAEHEGREFHGDRGFHGRR